VLFLFAGEPALSVIAGLATLAAWGDDGRPVS
jgi:hypothetical protein